MRKVWIAARIEDEEDSHKEELLSVHIGLAYAQEACEKLTGYHLNWTRDPAYPDVWESEEVRLPAISWEYFRVVCTELQP